MKKLSLLPVLVAGMLLTACSLPNSAPSPQSVARTHVAGHFEEMGADTTGLTYTVTAESETVVTLQVTGTVSVDHTLTLTSVDGRWVAAASGDTPPPQKDAASGH